MSQNQPAIDKHLQQALKKLEHNIQYWKAKKKLSDIGVGTIDGLLMAKEIVKSQIQFAKTKRGKEFSKWPFGFGIAHIQHVNKKS